MDFPLEDAQALQEIGADAETYLYLLRELYEDERDGIEAISDIKRRFSTLVNLLNSEKRLPSAFKNLVPNWNGYFGVERTYDIDF